ncbi:hypothetical protein C2G38_2030179 [Gigaspora rosea]|uniref:Uncharacterized protein n=1 Tax=Gigaspora rosea TaxID=44941 RepID=A0A397VVA0_9GLOM|nr:hypothetical protein C2G38_2030179 [Gigaspora rosea]
MSYYKDTKKVEKMFARLTTDGSNPAMAGSSSSATKKAKKAKKAKKNKDKGKTKEIKETVECAPLLIELFDRVSPASDVPIAPMTASYKYASGSGLQITLAEIKKLLDNQGKLMHKVDRLMARFEEMEERIDSRLRAVEDKLFATLDGSELQSFVESTVKGATNALIKKTIYPTQQELKEAVEDYLEENNYDFLQVLKIMHSKRGTLTTKIKDATPEKRSVLKSFEVQRETRSAKKQDATHNPEEDIAEGSGIKIPEKPRKRQKKDKEVQKAAAVAAVKPKN